uniref:Uncharacterized protein n=1 Tax=Naja naja TaxID=35670 RepID=A0A8C6VGK5_NAJNA
KGDSLRKNPKIVLNVFFPGLQIPLFSPMGEKSSTMTTMRKKCSVYLHTTSLCQVLRWTIPVVANLFGLQTILYYCSIAKMHY